MRKRCADIWFLSFLKIHHYPLFIKCTEKLVEKEKRSRSYADESYDSFSAEKTRKMTIFVKDYSRSLLQKLADRGKLLSREHGGQSDRVSSSDHTSSFSPIDDKSVHDVISSGPIDSQPSSHVDNPTAVLHLPKISHSVFAQQVTDQQVYSSSCSRHLQTIIVIADKSEA